MLPATAPQTRCCRSHSSYDELVEHLAAQFPDVGPHVVAREVARALAAARFVGLVSGDELLLMCELVARQRLELSTGRREDGARMDTRQSRGRRLAAVGEEAAR